MKLLSIFLIFNVCATLVFCKRKHWDTCTIENITPKMNVLANIYRSYTDRPLGNDDVPESLQPTKTIYDAYRIVIDGIKIRGHHEGLINQLKQGLALTQTEVEKQSHYITFYVRQVNYKYIAMMYGKLAQIMLDSPEAHQLDEVFKTKLVTDIQESEQYIEIHDQVMDSCDPHSAATDKELLLQWE